MGPLAQSVEQRTFNPWVVGSIPTGPTIKQVYVGSVKKCIGILPASGKATRLSGIPKFCLPIASNLTLIEWHVNQMLEVCDEVRISTRRAWVPILQEMNLNASVTTLEPSTMSDAVYKLAKTNEELIIGMPDTYIHEVSGNIYKEIIDVDAEIALGLWECDDYLKGKVGQVLLDPVDSKILKSQDKNMECDFPFMWGIIKFNLDKELLNRTLNHPGEQFQSFIDLGYDVKGKTIEGKYFDLGNFSVFKELYSSL